ncbi:MAG: hypothetical protein ACRBI6_13200 [Acidimicrobiales bacterium]
MTNPDTPVWYAAYGSNLSTDRFRTYLEGGPVPGSTTGRVQRGAADPSPPRADHPFLIDRELVFAGTSASWGGGGVAFLDADTMGPEAPTMGRIWGITLGQFLDVFAQENAFGGDELEVETLAAFDLDTTVGHGRIDLAERAYGRVELLDSIDGVPVLTITGRSRPTELRAAHDSYLRTIATGLAEAWGADAGAAARYLSALAPHHAGDAARLEQQLGTS